MKQTETIEHVVVEHCLENVLDLPPNSTVVEKRTTVTELVPIKTYDNLDQNIDAQLQNVIDTAMTAFKDQQDCSFMIDPKFKARNQEVAVQFLNTALMAIKEKSMLKQHKDRIGVTEREVEKPTVNNNLIVDRNVLLKMLRNDEK